MELCVSFDQPLGPLEMAAKKNETTRIQMVGTVTFCILHTKEFLPLLTGEGVIEQYNTATLGLTDQNNNSYMNVSTKSRQALFEDSL